MLYLTLSRISYTIERQTDGATGHSLSFPNVSFGINSSVVPGLIGPIDSEIIR